MSIPKEKLIIQEIKRILSDNEDSLSSRLVQRMKIKAIIDSYEDPGYITGPIVGTPEGTES